MNVEKFRATLESEIEVSAKLGGLLLTLIDELESGDEYRHRDLIEEIGREDDPFTDERIPLHALMTRAGRAHDFLSALIENSRDALKQAADRQT